MGGFTCTKNAEINGHSVLLASGIVPRVGCCVSHKRGDVAYCRTVDRKFLELSDTLIWAAPSRHYIPLQSNAVFCIRCLAPVGFVSLQVRDTLLYKARIITPCASLVDITVDVSGVLAQLGMTEAQDIKVCLSCLCDKQFRAKTI